MVMNPTRAAVPPLSMLVAALAVSACANPGGTVAVVGVGNLVRNNAQPLPMAVLTVGIQKHSAPSRGSSLSSIAPVAVRVLPFNDDRKDLDMEGKATAAFGVPMGQLRFAPSPATLVGQVITSEISAAGHAVAGNADGTQITGAVTEFEAHTDTALLYWDVHGILAVSLQIAAARGADPGAPIGYRARCMDRTYIWPSETVIAGVMGKCISDFADQLRNDGRAAARLQGLTLKAMADNGKVEREPMDVAASPRPGTEKSYTSPDRRWSISYPGDWTLDDSDHFVKISKGQAILGIHTFNDVAGKSLDEVADATVQYWEQRMRGKNVVRRVARQRMALAGDRTAIAIVHHIGSGQVGMSRKVMTIDKGRRILIDAETLLASWPDYERDFNRIIESFRVLE